MAVNGPWLLFITSCLILDDPCKNQLCETLITVAGAIPVCVNNAFRFETTDELDKLLMGTELVANQLSDTITSVSYTHLDVYKRQIN